MKTTGRIIGFACLALGLGKSPAVASATANLVKNPGFEQAGETADNAMHFVLDGDAVRRFAGTAYEFSTMGIALDSGRDPDGDGKHEGSVAQDVAIAAALPGRWFRFSIRGLPEDGFAVANDDLHLKVDFFGDGGKRSLDGVTRKIYPLVAQQRRDLGVNGVGRKGGAATWKTYAFEFRLPFPDIDLVRVRVGFRGGAGKGNSTSFLVDDLELVPIPAPADTSGQAAVRPAGPGEVDPARLVGLGGRWFYLPAEREAVPGGGRGLVVNERNGDRLLYHDGGRRYVAPFAANMSAWLRKGYLDLAGNLVEEDQLRPDNVTIRCDGTSLVVRARNLPNHPTARFPSPPGSGERNPSYIQEHEYTYYLPLKPERDPSARAMDEHNANRALNMGPIGIATNGVVFYNPFDAGMTDATDLMDRCCGHPSPDNRYHYHKYPVCVKSPFADEGTGHSPIIGWAFDGFAIYGPYESAGVMAKDREDNPLNDFNVHQDAERGWHYHATPGKFPYIIGGYWGVVDPRNGERRPRMAGQRPGGPPGPGGLGAFRPPPHPLMIALDADGDGALSAAEIAEAPAALRALDRNRDGVLSGDELRPPRPPGGFGPPPRGVQPAPRAGAPGPDR